MTGDRPPTTVEALAARHGRPEAYAYLDEDTKRNVRRAILKALAIPGWQVPFASREMPVARGWGSGGLQVTLSVVGPDDVVKVIDQGDDLSTNAVGMRNLISTSARCAATTSTTAATDHPESAPHSGVGAAARPAARAAGATSGTATPRGA